jgi:hypothetical protein
MVTSAVKFVTESEPRGLEDGEDVSGGLPHGIRTQKTTDIQAVQKPMSVN